jgi:hypothetical protein
MVRLLGSVVASIVVLASPLPAQRLFDRRLRLTVVDGGAVAGVTGRCVEERGDSLVVEIRPNLLRTIGRSGIVSAEIEEPRRPGSLSWGALPGLGVGAALGYALGRTREQAIEGRVAALAALPGLVIGGRGGPAARKVVTGAVAGAAVMAAMCVASSGEGGNYCGDTAAEGLLAGFAMGGVIGADVGALVSLLSTEGRWRPLSPTTWRVTATVGSGRVLVGLSRFLGAPSR